MPTSSTDLQRDLPSFRRPTTPPPRKSARRYNYSIPNPSRAKLKGRHVKRGYHFCRVFLRVKWARSDEQSVRRAYTRARREYSKINNKQRGFDDIRGAIIVVFHKWFVVLLQGQKPHVRRAII